MNSKRVIDGLRTLLVLGRVSNLPTVWSNLIVGWIIADGPWGGLTKIDYKGPDAAPWPISFVLVGGSFLYIGGMYLNDYCDAAFDVRYCPGRPIPAGKISRHMVGLLTALWFTAGLACFISFGPVTVGFTLLLIAAIVLYDFHHKNVAWAPLVMGICRCLLYLLAASSVREAYYFNTVYGDWWDDASDYIRNDCWAIALGISQRVLPLAIPLGLYVAGISYLARGESRSGKATLWPFLLLLLATIVLAGTYGIWIRSLHWLFVQNPHQYLVLLVRSLFPCLFLPGWIAWLLIPFGRKTNPSIKRVVSGLLAGIVLLDMMVLALQIGPYAIILLPLFIIALLLQRVIPAT